MSINSTTRNTAFIAVRAPQHILQSVLTARNDGEISAAVDQFDDHFTFNDQALGLELTDKPRLREFFQKVYDLFPDTVVEVISSLACADRICCEWKLTATRPGAHGLLQLRLPISLSGASIAQIDSGKIICWSDYYDEKTSGRLSLASFFTDWVAG